MMGMYKNGIREGAWVHYDQYGKEEYTENYKNGISDRVEIIKGGPPSKPIPEPSINDVNFR